jgi:1,2-diacylglycerol 3-beta-galactosyltransferase
MTRRILILMSDTGGGHRAAAEAIRDALHIRYGEKAVSVKLVDVFRDYSPVPLKFAPEFYPWWVNRSKTSWGVGYNMSNTRRRAQLLSQTMYVTIEGGLKRMLRENPADAVVCVHSLLTRPAMQALTWFTQRPPFVVVVTDLVSTHHLWYDKRCERCLVPTQPAYERGLAAGLALEQLRNTGLPVHPRFALGLKDKAEARHELGWDPDLPAVLVVGGGEGMGPVYRTARAIDERSLRCQLVVLAGNNKALKDKLESKTWNQPTRIYGFRKDMPLLMAATDILVTKAGPATISEACIAGVPMILYDAIPGQETGNIDYVVDNNVGVYAPTPVEVSAALASWLHRGPDYLRQMSENARALGRPNAVFEIAEEVWSYAHHSPIRSARRTLWTDIAETARELTDGLL